MIAGLLLGLLFAQEGVPPAQTPAADDVRRIRRALEEPVPISLVSTATHRQGSMFRVRIEAFEIGQPWKERSSVPGYVRPSLPLYHFEFLQQVTPEEFRAGTLYPGALGLPVVPIVEYVARAVSAARRASQQSRARDVVRKELERFLACRASKPGCRTP